LDHPVKSLFYHSVQSLFDHPAHSSTSCSSTGEIWSKGILIFKILTKKAGKNYSFSSLPIQTIYTEATNLNDIKVIDSPN
jgi:hypothetical protein